MTVSYKAKMPLVEQAREILNVERAIQLGGRLTSIRSISHLPAHKVNRIFLELDGIRTQGMSPSSPAWFSNYAHNSQAICVLHVLERKPGRDLATAIRIHEGYLDLIKCEAILPIIEFSRTVLIMRFFPRILSLTRCTCCNLKRLKIEGDLPDKTCCFCQVSAHAEPVSLRKHYHLIRKLSEEVEVAHA